MTRDGNGKRRKSNNQGLTLIELVVAAAILVIVVGMGMSFVVRASGLFNRSNENTTAQNEAQLTMTRLQSLIVGASHGVSVRDPSNPGTAPDDKALYVYNRVENVVEDGFGDAVKTASYQITHIFLDDTDASKPNSLKYEYLNYTLESDGTAKVEADAGIGVQVLSQYVRDFQVDMSDFDKKKSVKITIDVRVREDGTPLLMENTFLLRNEISKNTQGAADDYFKADAVAEQKNQITSVKISPASTYMWEGSTLASPFSVSAMIDGNERTGIPVVWSIVEGNGVDATINRSAGTLHVNSIDAGLSDIMTVQATALSTINENTGNYKYDTAKVYVKSFQGVAVSDALPMADDDHKTYWATFLVRGINLQKDVDMSSAPFVAEGSSIGATFEPQPESSGPAQLKWKVKIRRPANYENNSYKLIVGYKLNGKTMTCELDGIRFTPSTAEENQGVPEIRLWDDTTETAYTNLYGITSVAAQRGGTRELQLQMRYNGGVWMIQDPDDWSITADHADVKITKSALGYRLTFGVKEYNRRVAVNLTTHYTDNHGASAQGPMLQLEFKPVTIRLAGVTGSQTTFPVANGGTESFSFVIDNLEGAQVYLLDTGDASDNSTMRVTLKDVRASIKVSMDLYSSRTYRFGVRTADKELLGDEVCCELTFVPAQANVFADAQGTMTKLFIPKADDITNYSNQADTPGEGETAMLYTAGGVKLVYSRQGGKYYLEYSESGGAKRYRYDSALRGWVPMAD